MASNKKLQEENSELAQQIADLTEDNQRLKEQIAALTEDVTELTEENERIEENASHAWGVVEATESRARRSG